MAATVVTEVMAVKENKEKKDKMLLDLIVAKTAVLGDLVETEEMRLVALKEEMEDLSRLLSMKLTWIFSLCLARLSLMEDPEVAREKTVVEAQVDKVVKVVKSLISTRPRKFNKRIPKESFNQQLLSFLIQALEVVVEKEVVMAILVLHKLFQENTEIKASTNLLLSIQPDLSNI
jgi:hypothetical protein